MDDKNENQEAQNQNEEKLNYLDQDKQANQADQQNDANQANQADELNQDESDAKDSKDADAAFEEELKKRNVAPQHEMQDGIINRENRDRSKVEAANHDLRVKNIERALNNKNKK